MFFLIIYGGIAYLGIRRDEPGESEPFSGSSTLEFVLKSQCGEGSDFGQRSDIFYSSFSIASEVVIIKIPGSVLAVVLLRTLGCADSGFIGGSCVNMAIVGMGPGIPIVSWRCHIGNTRECLINLKSLCAITDCSYVGNSYIR
jgi:hypothetical protein